MSTRKALVLVSGLFQELNSSSGQAVVRVGEASTATKFAIRIEPPIKLS